MQRSGFGLGDRGATRPRERFCPSSLPAAPRAAANHIWGWEISFEALLMQRWHGTGPGLSPLSKARKESSRGKAAPGTSSGEPAKRNFPREEDENSILFLPPHRRASPAPQRHWQRKESGAKGSRRCFIHGLVPLSKHGVASRGP